MSGKPTYEELEQRVRVLEQAQSISKYAGDFQNESEWYRSILNTINEGVILESASGEVIFWNKAAENIFGIPANEAVGRNLEDMNLTLINEHGLKIDKKDQPSEKTLCTQKPCRNEILGFYRTPGDLCWLSVNAHPLFNNDDQNLYAVALSLSDITELKMERDLSQNYLDVAGVMIIALNEAGEVTLINRKGCEILEGTENDFIGKNWFDLFTPKEILKEVKDAYRELIEGKIDATDYAEYYINTPSGKIKVIAWHNTILRDKDGKIIGALSSGEDITEKKEAEERLRESERRHRTIIHTAMDGFQLFDMNDRILEVNDAYCKMSGYSREELLGMNIIDLEADPQANSRNRNRQALIAKGENRLVLKHKRKDGTLIDVEISAQYQQEEKMVVSFLRDITTRKKAEESLREREALLNRSQEMASMGSFVWDMMNNSLIWSKNMYRIYGCDEENLTENLFDVSNRLMHPQDAKRANREILEMIKKDNIWDTEFRIIRTDGVERIIRSKGEMEINDEGIQVKCFGVNHDITERKQAEKRIKESEEKLVRSKKMESLGLLAGGVAHDLNNVLSGIVSYPELLLLDLPEGSKYRKPIETIQDSGMRAVAIVQDLLTIARGVASQKEPLNLNDIIREYKASPEYRKLRQYHPTVDIRTYLSRDLMNINASPIHIRKVIMNLISNASEAIENRGDVTISTRNCYVDHPVKGYEDVTEGEYAVLSVSDQGSGILSEHLERIFEPFFTKKEMGRSGTGLGLAVVWNIVQDHGGYIDVSSNSSGTAFKIYFPIIRNGKPAEAIPRSIDIYKGNGESVLVIDDEENQREITCKIIETLGYKTEAVSSGEEAVQYLREKSADIILLDMIMTSGMSGRETYKAISKIHPGQKAIIVSGFAETDEVREIQKLGAGRYIRKPLRIYDIAKALREELDREKKAERVASSYPS